MRALSIKQPWAWLIVNGIKDIENRNWKSNYRGMLLIHASKTFDLDGFNWIAERFNINMPRSQDFLKGYFVGVVKMVDCVDHHPSKWFKGPWGFVFESSETWDEPIKYRGQLKIFDVSARIFACPSIF